MLHLPVDILLLISSLLVPRDKLECMTVCRQWYSIIRDHSLYRVIFLQSKRQVDSLMDKVKRNSFLGEQVERIQIKIKLSDRFDDALLSRLFPNVHVFERLDKNSFHSRHVLSLHQPHPWCKRIEHISEIDYDIHTSAILSSGICRNLTSISVARRSAVAGYNIFEVLQNAPMLKDLHLKNYTITIKKLETIHLKLEHLATLKLECSFMRCDNPPLNIEPATSVKKFHRYISSYDNHYFSYSHYISKKYTHVEELEIKFEELHIQAENEPEQRAILTSYLASISPYLKTLKLVFRIDNHESDDDEDADIDERPTGYFKFSMLDECGCQIENIELGVWLDYTVLFELSRTKQVQSILSLTINYMVVGIYAGFPFDWLERFPNLKELIISFDVPPWHENKLKLVNLLDGLSKLQLETLKLYSMRFEMDSSTTHTLPSLKNLTITMSSVVAGVDSTINQLFPNLKRLMVRSVFWSTKSLMLTNLNLSYLHIFQNDASAFTSVLVQTLDNNQQRMYTWTGMTLFRRPDIVNNNNNLFPLPSPRSQPYDRLKHTPDITIVCKSLAEFNMTKEENK